MALLCLLIYRITASILPFFAIFHPLFVSPDRRGLVVVLLRYGVHNVFTIFSFCFGQPQPNLSHTNVMIIIPQPYHWM